MSVQLQISTNQTTGFSAYVDHQTGEAFFTFSSLVKLIGIDNKTLTRIISTHSIGNFAEKYSEVLTGAGVRSIGELIQAKDLKTIITAYNPTKIEQKLRKQQIVDALMDAGATAYAYNLCGYRMVQEEDQKEVEQIKLSDIERCVELSSKIEKMRDSDARKILKNQLHSFLGIQPTRKVSSSMDLAYKLGFRPELSVYLHLEKFVASKCEAINPGHGVMGTYYFEDEIEETVREFFNRD